MSSDDLTIWNPERELGTQEHSLWQEAAILVPSSITVSSSAHREYFGCKEYAILFASVTWLQTLVRSG